MKCFLLHWDLSFFKSKEGVGDSFNKHDNQQTGCLFPSLSNQCCPPTSLSLLRSKIVILIFQLQSSEWQWRLNAEWTMNALWTIGERTVSERWTLCERWTRANGERWTQNCERWTHDERTLNARWTDGERTVNERKNGKVERFRDWRIAINYLLANMNSCSWIDRINK